jgi:VanZ family protein
MNINIVNGDKYIHYFMYCIFTLILLFEINEKKFKIKFILLKLTFLAVFLSGIIEIMQEYLTDHRSGEWMDFLANSLGSLTALLFFITFKNFLK